MTTQSSPDSYTATSTVLGALHPLRVWTQTSWIARLGTAITTTVTTTARNSRLNRVITILVA